MENQQQHDQSATSQDIEEPLAPTQQNRVIIEWSASEYIAHHKSVSWYAGLGAVVAVLSALVYLFTADVISVVVIILVGALFGVFAARKPEVRSYQITPGGLLISGKLYDFRAFKSFSVHDEDVVRSIFFMPIKRFLPGLTVYYPPDQEDKIVEILSNYLPNEENDPDMIDNFMRKVRF